MTRPSSARWYGSGRNQDISVWKKRKAIRDIEYHKRVQRMSQKHPSLIMYEYMQKVKHEDRSTEK